MKSHRLYVSSFLLLIILFIAGCSGQSGSGDDPVVSAASAEQAFAFMFDDVTDMGIRIQSNGFEVDPLNLDETFVETLECSGFEDVPIDNLYIKLEKPYSAFPCIPLPNGCGGLFDLDNNEPVITVTADLIRLKHEFLHYILYYVSGNSDSEHENIVFDQCS